MCVCSDLKKIKVCGGNKKKTKYKRDKNDFGVTMTACDRGLRGGRDGGVDLLPSTVSTQEDSKKPANKTVMTPEPRWCIVHMDRHTLLY